jgi:hypothetical protein
MGGIKWVLLLRDSRAAIDEAEEFHRAVVGNTG